MRSTRRIAVLSDIHGNLPALEAVLADLAQQGLDEVIVAGDLVGRGPQGTAIVERIAATSWPCIRGNHEEYLLGFVRREVPEAWWQAEEWSASVWMAAELSADAVRFISPLPFDLRPRHAPDMHIVHGSTRSTTEGLGVWTADERLREEIEPGDRVLICGHTHRPMLRTLDDVVFCNIGSVGLPFNGDPRAQYGIFECTGDEWRVELRQCAYEIDDTIRAYRNTGFWKAGGPTAQLLAMELWHARPFLVPFLHWAQQTETPPHASSIDRWLEEHAHPEPVAAFASRLGLPLDDR